MAEVPSTEFRWQYWDDALGQEWSDWHVVTGPCPACCCDGPDDGEHQQASEYYDEDGILSNGHSRLDPHDTEGRVVEWRGRVVDA